MRQTYEILSMTVEELLAQDPAAGDVLSEYGIDLCRCWGLAVETAARTVSTDPARVAAALAAKASPDGVGEVPHPLVLA